jgi:hypothetical protein
MAPEAAWRRRSRLACLSGDLGVGLRRALSRIGDDTARCVPLTKHHFAILNHSKMFFSPDAKRPFFLPPGLAIAPLAPPAGSAPQRTSGTSQ